MADKTQEINTEIQDVGTVRISEEVAAAIASIATEEVQGVAEIVGSKHSTLIGGGKKSPGKGIRIALEENGAVVELSIIVTYGSVLLEVAENVQKSVKNSVENMTGISVREVNVSIDGVQFPEKPRKEKAEKKPASRKPEAE